MLGEKNPLLGVVVFESLYHAFRGASHGASVCQNQRSGLKQTPWGGTVTLMERYLTQTEVKARLASILGRTRRGDRIVITRSGRPRAVLIDYQQFETLAAAASLLQDPSARAAMARAAAEVRAGETYRLKGKPSVRRLVAFAKRMPRRTPRG